MLTVLDCSYLSTDSTFFPSLSQDKEPRGIIPLENLEIRECLDSKRNVSVIVIAKGGTMWVM